MNDEKKAEMSIMGLALALLFVSMSWPLLKFGDLEIPLPDEASYAEWITSAFIIAEVAFAPVAGKLVDRLGLRPCVVFGTRWARCP